MILDSCFLNLNRICVLTYIDYAFSLCTMPQSYITLDFCTCILSIQLVLLAQLKIFKGRKLDFEPKHCGKQRSEQDFMTAVEFSAEDPYGKAVALLDLKSGLVKVQRCFLFKLNRIPSYSTFSAIFSTLAFNLKQINR